MTRWVMLATLVLIGAVTSDVRAAERQWQKGVWREVSAERPRMSFGIQTRDPNSSLPRQATAREVRRYVIETKTHRFELREDATAGTPRIDALVGEPVLFAIEKKIVYIKDDEGKEHKLNLSKQSPLPK